MYKSLQMGRAVAAILVVLLHLGNIIAMDKYFAIKSFAIPFSFGGGVDFFFVLSGFIIFKAHKNDINQPQKLITYIRKRFTRIYPTYWIIFLAVFFLAITLSSLRNTVPHDTWILVKSFLLLPQERVHAIGSPVIGVAWSLQYELCFYFFFAFLILNKWLGIAFGTGLLYLYISYTRDPSISFPLSFITQDYLLLFAMGMIVSILSSAKNISIDKAMSFLFLGLFMFIINALDSVSAFNLLGEWRAIVYGIASSFIIFGLVQAENKGHIIGGHPYIQILGDSSYVLYLIHLPLMSLLCKILILLDFNHFGYTGAIASFVIIFVICLLSSVIFYSLVEKKILHWLRTSNSH